MRWVATIALVAALAAVTAEAGLGAATSYTHCRSFRYRHYGFDHIFIKGRSFSCTTATTKIKSWFRRTRGNGGPAGFACAREAYPRIGGEKFRCHDRRHDLFLKYRWTQ